MGAYWATPAVVYAPHGGAYYYNPMLYGGYYYRAPAYYIWSKVDQDAYAGADEEGRAIIAMKYMTSDDLMKYQASLEGMPLSSQLRNTLQREISSKADLRQQANWVQWHSREDAI